MNSKLSFNVPNNAWDIIIQKNSYYYFLTVQRSFIFSQCSCHELTGSGLQQLRPLSVGSHTVLLWVEQVPFSLASFFF